MNIEKLIQEKQIIICAGSGGVGKTTISAAIAQRAASEGYRVLVLTIDPAKRLATTLGLTDTSGDYVRVPDQNFKGELWAAVVNSQKVFDDFIHQYIQEPEKRDIILKNRLYRQISTTLSGSQEYTALEKLFQAYNSKKFDRIILDTPPSQHAVDFLKAPQKMYALFQSHVVKWFLPQTSKSALRNFLDKSTKTVFKTLESLTGADFLEELRAFFLVIDSLRERIQSHSAEIHSLLVGQGSAFVVVTSFDAMKIEEARRFRKLLLASGYNLTTVVINRAFPEWAIKNESVDKKTELHKRLAVYYEDLKRYYSKNEDAFAVFSQELHDDLTVVRVPDFDQDINSLQNLDLVSRELVNSGAR